jgi:transcriptional regulator NrdR family protein
MVCIYCGGKTRIVNSRPQKRSHSTWRRHHCSSCGATFTTQERVDLATSVAFINAKGVDTPFSREKLLQSLYECLKHRSKPLTEALHLTDTVIAKLIPQVNQASLPRSVVVATAHKVLSRFNTAAAVQYQAYHPINKF